MNTRAGFCNNTPLLASAGTHIHRPNHDKQQSRTPKPTTAVHASVPIRLHRRSSFPGQTEPNRTKKTYHHLHHSTIPSLQNSKTLFPHHSTNPSSRPPPTPAISSPDNTAQINGTRPPP